MIPSARLTVPPVVIIILTQHLFCFAIFWKVGTDGRKSGRKQWSFPAEWINFKVWVSKNVTIWIRNSDTVGPDDLKCLARVDIVHKKKFQVCLQFSLIPFKFWISQRKHAEVWQKKEKYLHIYGIYSGLYWKLPWQEQPYVLPKLAKKSNSHLVIYILQSPDKKSYKTGVINDPLGQPTVSTGSDCRLI